MRPLLDQEIQECMNSFNGKFNKRDIAIFMLGMATGFRIKEILSLRICDVYNIEKKQLLPTIHVQKQNMKKKQSRAPVQYSTTINKYLLDWINALGSTNSLDPLFQSQKDRDGEKSAITVRSAIRIFKTMYKQANILDEANVGTHSMRKTFAKKVYIATGKDLLKTQKIMGHKNIDSTTKYLATCDSELNDISSNISII